jgi:phosphoglucomutase
VARIPFERARSASTVHPHQYLDAYVRDLPSVIDLQAIRESKVRISGATFLRRDGTVWTTDKDGLVPNLLASEITARTGKDPGEHYQELTCQFGMPYYTRIDAPATPEQKARLEKLSPEALVTLTLAGEPSRDKLIRAPVHGAPIGGLKVVTENGWFAARPSGTENIYKIYAESFKDQQDLDAIVSEAQEIVNDALKVL